MLSYFLEVLFGLLSGGGSQTFVVLDFPAFEVPAFSPLFILVDGEEGDYLITTGGFNDWCDELLHEAVEFD